MSGDMTQTAGPALDPPAPGVYARAEGNIPRCTDDSQGPDGAIARVQMRTVEGEGDETEHIGREENRSGQECRS